MKIYFNPAMSANRLFQTKNQAFQAAKPTEPTATDKKPVVTNPYPSDKEVLRMAASNLDKSTDLIKGMLQKQDGVSVKDPFARSTAVTAALSKPIEELNRAAKSDPLSRLLATEATKRIEGSNPWPDIKDIKAWMVSAETQTFMKVGGLAEVAVQLPDSFNKKYGDDPNNKMTIVTPLYVGAPQEGKKGKKAAIEKLEGNKFLYNGAEGKSIELEYVRTISTDVFNPATNSFKREKADVLKGELNGTNYIFLRNDNYFGITPHTDNNPACEGAYVYNDKGVAEVERMTFFSKASYELQKLAIDDKSQGITAPNVIIANDWHASSMSTMMRYSNPVEFAKKLITTKVKETIDNTPIIHITHNNEYQGSTSNNADAIFRTLLGKDTDNINARIKGYKEEGFPLANGWGNFNEAMSDLYLADRLVAVSPNYANELCTSSMGAGFEHINGIRKQHNTMLGIVNGYTKSLAEPNTSLIKIINDKLKLSPAQYFEPYDNQFSEVGYSIKMQNKQKMIEVMNDMIKTANSGGDLASMYGFSLYDSQNCALPQNLDTAKVPFIASVGRFVEQKGFDYMAQSLTTVLSNLKPGQEKPIVAILGSGDESYTKQLKELKDKVALTDPEAAKRIFIFTGFSPGLRDALGVASDFFLIPSKWEPCGLTQMEAMPKGSLPIATATGGLADTIVDSKDGFLTDVFYSHRTGDELFINKSTDRSIPRTNVAAFEVAIDRALNTFYTDPAKIKEMAINAMTKDFSWNVPGGSLEQYESLMRTGKVA